MTEEQKDRSWQVLCGIAGPIFCATFFYSILTTFGKESTDAIFLTFVIGWIAGLKKFQGKWPWTIPHGLLFLGTGALMVWAFCRSFDPREGYANCFPQTLAGLAEATAMIFGLALAGVMVGAIHYYALCKK